MKTKHAFAYGVLALLAFNLSAISSSAGGNLVINGSFDDPHGPLVGWKSKYTSHLERQYKENHKHVSVVKEIDRRSNVLKFECRESVLMDEGVKVDTYPIKFKPGQRFRLSARAKSTGPKCRFLVQGFRWRPDIEPHKHPKYEELRRVYRFGVLYFNDPETGVFSHVTKDGGWDRGKLIFPDREQTEMGQKFLKKVDFIMVHIVAIAGKAGKLYVDDVSLKRID